MGLGPLSSPTVTSYVAPTNHRPSVGIDLKGLGGGVSCRNVCNFARGSKFTADFHSKMGVCRHELGEGSTPTPPLLPTIPALHRPVFHRFRSAPDLSRTDGRNWSIAKGDTMQCTKVHRKTKVSEYRTDDLANWNITKTSRAGLQCELQ